MAMMPPLYVALHVLMRQRSAYQRVARVLRPIAVVAMRGPNQVLSPRDMPRLNEKQEALPKQSRRWWMSYRSFTRALSLLSRMYYWSAVGS